MAEKQLTFALFGNTFQEKKATAVQKLLAVLERYEATIAVEQSFHEFLTDKLQIHVPACRLISDNDFVADFVVCMWGDGTFLDVASRVGNKQMPIIGFNMGHLGFLASFTADEIEQVIQSIYSGGYQTVDHSVLQLVSDENVIEGYPFALNEIPILKHDISSMIKIHTHINGEYLTTYQADGLIVGTPTGSTAYSLSVGGPIVVPQSQTMTLTPVAPHSLNMRPLVLCDDAEVSLVVESRSHHFLVSVDGRSQSYDEGIHLHIRRAPYTVKVVTRQGQSYFTTLCRKMMWGADRRNV